METGRCFFDSPQGSQKPAGAGLSSATILVSLLTLGVPAFLLTRQFGLSFYELVFISAAKRPADQMFFPAPLDRYQKASPRP